MALRSDDIGIAKAAMAEIDRRQSEGGVEEFGERIAQCRDDLRLLEDLNRIDKVRWSRFIVNGSRSDFRMWEIVAKTCATALPLHGVVVRENAIEATARRINSSLVRERLLRTLDMWLRAIREPSPLVNILHVADPDTYRDSIRASMSTQSWDRMRELANQPAALKQPARFALLLGSFDETKSVFDPVIPSKRRYEILMSAWLKNPTNVGILIALGDTDDKQAVRWFQAAISADPNNARTWDRLAEQLRTKDAQGAIACYREAIRLDPSNGDYYNDMAGWLMGGNVDNQIALYREAIRVDPTNAMSHLNLGHRLAEKGKLDEAILEIREGDRLMGKRWFAPPDHIGDYLLRKGDVEGAIKEYQEALRRGHGMPEVRRKLGDALSRKGDFEQAVAQYRAALRRSGELIPNSPPIVHQSLAETLIRKGDLDGAILAYRDAAQLYPANRLILDGLIGVLARKEKASDVLAEYLKLDPKAERHYILSHLAVAYLRAGKQSEMESLIRQTLAERKETIEYSHSLAYLGEALFEKEKWAEAEPVLRDCLTIREKRIPDHWWTPYTGSLLGLVLARQKKYKEAETQLVLSYNLMKKHYPPSKPWDLGVPDQRRATVAQLVLLYDAVNNPDETAKWREELAKYPADGAKARTGK